MLFNVAGLTVDMLLVKKNLNVGYCCAYMYIQHTNFEGGGRRDSCGAGEDPPHPPPPWPYIEKCCIVDGCEVMV